MATILINGDTITLVLFSVFYLGDCFCGGREKSTSFCNQNHYRYHARLSWRIIWDNAVRLNLQRRRP